MKRTRLLALPVVLLLVIAATRRPAPTHLLAQGAAAATQGALQGTFTLEPGAEPIVVKAITDGTAKMNFIKRPIGRSRLKKTNLPPYAWVKIEHTPAQVSIEMDGRKPIVTPADGKTIKWTREDGEVFDVNTVWEQGNLKETFTAGDGSRENLFEPTAEGMIMQVTIRSPQLPAPIVYRLAYRKKA